MWQPLKLITDFTTILYLYTILMKNVKENNLINFNLQNKTKYLKNINYYPSTYRYSYIGTHSISSDELRVQELTHERKIIWQQLKVLFNMNVRCINCALLHSLITEHFPSEYQDWKVWLSEHFPLKISYKTQHKTGNESQLNDSFYFLHLALPHFAMGHAVASCRLSLWFLGDSI